MARALREAQTGLEKRVQERTAELSQANAQLTAEIAERQRAEADSAKQRTFLRQVIDLNPSFIFAKDREGRFTLANKSLAEAYGTTVENLIGKKDVDFNQNYEAIELMLRDDLEVINSRHEKFIPEEQITDSSGNVRWLQTIKRPLTLGDVDADQVLGVATDITERKQAETERRMLEEQLIQSQKLESIGTLAGGVAHDFNNLLTVILGNTQLSLFRLSPDSEVRERLLEVERAADRAATLTRQLLAFSRRQQLERKPINLQDTIHDIMKLLRRVIGEDVEIRFNTAASLPRVFADASQIEQVVMNLAINARDAMPNGGTLIIETCAVTVDQTYLQKHPLAKPGNYAEIVVSDTGTGMDEQTKTHIFEPFFTTKPTGKGTGLGLAMVYGIVKQHDGLIDVYSEISQGTTFRIYLPVVETTVIEDAAREQVPVHGGNETILVAEDEEALRGLARAILEELGYTVLLARDGQEAIDIYTTNRDKIELVILDVVMPRMGAHEACKLIRSLDSSVPVMFMTGYSLEMVQTKFAENSDIPLIQKPYSVEGFGRKVREVLDATLV
jgi:PAS domain S-box-containing protein